MTTSSKLGVQFFCIAIGLVALYFSYAAGEKVLLYMRTQNSKLADNVEFSVVEGSWGRYYFLGSFQYEYQGGRYEGKTRLSDPVFMNEGLAEEKAALAKNKKWTVYFDAAHPVRATLERKIPFKEIVYALLSWISLGYFVLSVRKLNKKI